MSAPLKVVGHSSVRLRKEPRDMRGVRGLHFRVELDAIAPNHHPGDDAREPLTGRKIQSVSQCSKQGLFWSRKSLPLAVGHIAQKKDRQPFIKYNIEDSVPQGGKYRAGIARALPSLGCRSFRSSAGARHRALFHLRNQNTRI